jgi:hypothetical protein
VKTDPVVRPAHYNFGRFEVIEVIMDWGLNFTRGSAVKYIARAGRKNPDTELEDLRKAREVLDREISRLEKS